MKKSLLLNIVLVSSIISLCCAVAAAFSDNYPQGIVHFESTEIPALNFTMPVAQAAGIYCMMPESFTEVCRQEYVAICNKCARSDRFTHEGVKIQCIGSDPSMEFVFTIPGYKLVVSGVSWETLDKMFFPDNE